MELEFLGTSGAACPERGSQAFLLGGTIAIDAGSLASGLSLERARRIRTVLLTHRHFDHLRELPLFLDNAGSLGAPACEVGAEAGTLACLARHVFNWDLWPDPRRFEIPQARFFTLRTGRTFRRGGLRITAVRLHHTVPSVGYVLRRGSAAVAILGDTGPSDAVFRRLARIRGLRFLTVECSYPSRLDGLARATLHLTPDLLAPGLAILRRAHPRLRVLATHVKPLWTAEIRRELRRLDPPLEMARDGMRVRIF